MTTVIDGVEQQQRQRDELLRREFDIQLEESGDGRTLEGLCVPYNVATVVDDGMGAYKEMFVQGAFARAVRAPFRVWLNFEHKPGISNVLGNGVKFEERPEGLYGVFELDQGSETEKAKRLHSAGVLSSLSVEFKPMERPKQIRGVVERRSVHLDAVALCRRGAYEEAKVTVIRTDPIIVDDSYLPAPMDSNLAARLARMNLPSGYTASDPLARAFTDQPWDGSESRWPDAESYCSACLVDNNPAGQAKTKEQCHFPVKEPGSGDYNVNALQAVAGGRGSQATFPGAQEARQRAERLLAEYNDQQGNQ